MVWRLGRAWPLGFGLSLPPPAAPNPLEPVTTTPTFPPTCFIPPALGPTGSHWGSAISAQSWAVGGGRRGGSGLPVALLGANLGPRGWNCHCDSYWQQLPHLPICSLYPHTTLSLGVPRPVPSRPHRQPFQPWSLLPIPPSFPPGGHPVQGPSGQLLCLLLTELPLGPAGSGVAAVGRHLPVPPPTSPVAVCPNLGPEQGMAKSGGVASQGRTGGWKTTGSWRGGPSAGRSGTALSARGLEQSWQPHNLCWQRLLTWPALTCKCTCSPGEARCPFPGRGSQGG